jgi:tetratricopeptide (TPR) repeat protein
MSLILLLTAVLFSTPGAQDGDVRRADALFSDRDKVESLKQAIAILEQQRSRDASNYDVLWRLGKCNFYLSDRGQSEPERIKILEAGIDAARKAVALNDKRVEGHFWLGATQGSYAELKGAFTSLGLIRTIRREFEAAKAIDASYENGSVYVALGEMDLSLPRLLGGSDRRGFQTLEAGMAAFPNNAELRVTLGERYFKDGRRNEARRLLESVQSTSDPIRSPQELNELRSKAKKLIKELDH